MRFLASLTVWLAVGIAVAMSGAAGRADQWTAYRMAEVAFEAPADWTVTRRQRDRAFVLQDPKRQLELRIEWWFQDEPILGHDHILSSKKISVAGKPAIYIHSAFPSMQTLTAVLNETRKDGRKLLLVLESTGPDMSVMAPLFENVLARVSFGGSAAAPPRKPPVAVKSVEQQSGGMSVAAGTDATVFHDAEGQFALRRPEGWRRGITARDGIRAVTFSPADRQALILVAVLTATPERDVAGVVEDFVALYYDNYFLPDSIEADGDLRIGTLDGQYVDMFGQVHPVEGVRLAFSDGRSWLFKSVGEKRAYIVAYIHARSAPAALKAALDDAARSLRIAADAAALLKERDRAGPAAPAAASARQTPLSAQMRGVARHFANDCEAISLAAWNHPALGAIRKRRQAHLEWVMLCRNRSHAVFGVNFDYDPQGRTSDFFTPLYDEMLAANRNAPFSIAVLKDKLIIDVARPGRDEISVDFREMPDLPEGADVTQQRAAAAASPYLPAPDDGKLPVWLGPVSFEPPFGWQLQPDGSGRLMAMVRPDAGAEILVILWPAGRPMPSAGVERIEHTVIAGEPATRLRERSGTIRIDHIFFDEPFPDGSRLSVAYRARGESVEDGAPLLNLFLANLNRRRPAPGGPTLWMTPGTVQAADPFADLDMSELQTRR